MEVDGTLIGIFTPGSTSYATYASAPFKLRAGDHTIAFVGVDPSGADYTVLLDQASINNVSPPGFWDSSFENPSQGSGESALFRMIRRARGGVSAAVPAWRVTTAPHQWQLGGRRRGARSPSSRVPARSAKQYIPMRLVPAPIWVTAAQRGSHSGSG